MIGAAQAQAHTIVKCVTTMVTGLLAGLLAVALGRITQRTTL